ncbi:18.8 kDa class II heat shock protein [Vitis vinifera]|uniref:18.8 kDa class II heat shock protein n=1 Tax=Vitis vinifera TaxID=29760 RepID=A0A438EXI6_VITVI|nr:18.8 kDa class II heat shock protein [Vitis vinifera]
MYPIEEKEEEEKKRRKMDWRIMGLDSSMLSALHDMIDMYEEPKTQQPSRAYVRDHKAMNATQADVKEYPNSYVFLVDMPGLKPDQIKVQIEEPNMLVVFGERKHEKEKDEKEGVKFLRMERRLGKFLKTFMLPENANPEAISAVYQDGVLTVTVEKKPLPEPKESQEH